MRCKFLFDITMGSVFPIIINIVIIFLSKN